MQSTIKIFRHLYNNLPPLFPRDRKERIKIALNHLENDPRVTLREAEDTMINFGYEVWPWNQAYREFLVGGASKVGEHFLLSGLSPELREKYAEFKAYGGTIADLHSGSGANFFMVEERLELCPALIDLARDIRQYVNRGILGLEREAYLGRVDKFNTVLKDISSLLNQLFKLALEEKEHHELAKQILARARNFEEGLCWLGPELNYEEVRQSLDFFKDRQAQLTQMRGIHLPVEVDFYRL